MHLYFQTNIKYVWSNKVWFLLFYGISTLFKLFNAKAILLEEHQWYYLTHRWEDKGVHIFPKGICPKVNVIAQLEYELAYYDSAVHHFNHYPTRTPPCSNKLVKVSKVGVCRRGWPEGSLFNSYNTAVCGEGTIPFLRLIHFTHNMYLILLSVKLGGIK